MNEKETARKRRRQIKKLLAASTLVERQRIRKAQREGRRWRKELEQFEQGKK